jgi:hypothetical protein
MTNTDQLIWNTPATKAFNFFFRGIEGYVAEKHARRHRRHNRSTPDDEHYDLASITDTDMSTALPNPSFLKPDDLVHHQITPERYESVFCGITPGQIRPKQVCLPEEESRAIAPSQHGDIDSFLGYLNSPAPLVKQNIATGRFTEGFRYDVTPG